MKLDLNTLWKLLPTQEKFLKALSETKPNEYRSIAYIGAFGSGKTWALCRGAIGLALSYPGIRILIGRQHATDLRDSTRTTFYELINDIEEKLRGLYPPELRSSVPPIGNEHKSDNEYEFSNGSLIMFRPLEDAERKYKSLNVAAVGIDEGSEVDINSVQMLMGRRRQMGYPLILFVVSNPTGLTHWIYRWWVREVRKDLKDSYLLFRTNTAENQVNLPPDYIKELMRRYPLDWVRRYVNGEWGGLEEGVPIFAGFDLETHIKPGLFYKRLPVWVGIDFGYQTPGVVWAHPTKERVCQVIREWAPKQLDTHKLAEGIVKRNNIWFPGGQFLYFCGHDGMQHAPHASKTNLEILQSYGLNATYRNHHVETGLTVIRNLIRMQSNGKPNLVVDPSCHTIIEGFMGEYRYHPKKEDIPKKDGIFDPLFDAIRYIAVQNYSWSGEEPQSKTLRLFHHKKEEDADS
jgi:PBSX family phage terminase large subunit